MYILSGILINKYLYFWHVCHASAHASAISCYRKEGLIIYFYINFLLVVLTRGAYKN